MLCSGHERFFLGGGWCKLNECTSDSGEGPWGLVVCPSRELASQTTDVVNFFATALHEGGYPQLRCLCMIGGVSTQEQVSVCQFVVGEHPHAIHARLRSSGG